MRYKCDNKIAKGDKEFVCGRFLGKIEGLVLELKCPNCKKVHKIDVNRPIEAHELVHFLESNLTTKQEAQNGSNSNR